MTGTDSAITLPLYGGPPPLDGPLPNVFVTLDSEYFVEWQVADMAPVSGFPVGGLSSGAE